MATKPRLTYPQVKTAMASIGLPVSAGATWTPKDMEGYQRFVSNSSYVNGLPVTDTTLTNANYGFPYPDVMPTAVVDSVIGATYSCTVAPSSAAVANHANVTFTVTETGGTASSFLWNFGDGTTATTTTPSTTHNYSAVTTTTFTVSVTPTVSGVVDTPATTTVKAVVYTATLAGSPTSGAHPLLVTFTLTETAGGPGTSYSWDFGDSSGLVVTTVPTTTHTYAAAGSRTAVVTATVQTVLFGITATAPIVVS